MNKFLDISMNSALNKISYLEFQITVKFSHICQSEKCQEPYKAVLADINKHLSNI